jgi:hypothetical protein
MSTRIGMADGRCLTEFTSSKLLHEEIMKKNGIDVYDNYKFRLSAQESGPDGLSLPLKNAACGTSEVSVLVSQEEGKS